MNGCVTENETIARFLRFNAFLCFVRRFMPGISSNSGMGNSEKGEHQNGCWRLS